MLLERCLGCGGTLPRASGAAARLRLPPAQRGDAERVPALHSRMNSFAMVVLARDRSSARLLQGPQLRQDAAEPIALMARPRCRQSRCTPLRPSVHAAAPEQIDV